MMRVRSAFSIGLAALLLAGCGSMPAYDSDSDRVGTIESNQTSLGTEDVEFVSKHFDFGDVNLETTVYRPTSKPPWPLVVFNHGANGALKSPHLQERARPNELAKFFLARGYMVAAPMREGFARSTGEVQFRCNHAEYALTYARDIRAVVDDFVIRGEADPHQVVVVGQSNGGMVTLGYGAANPTAKGIVILAGGVDTANPACDWRSRMISAASTLGARTKIPSLWMYAADDQIFAPSISRPFFSAYRAAGAPAAFHLFSDGGHGFALRNGSALTWGDEMSSFLLAIGLPTDLLH